MFLLHILAFSYYGALHYYTIDPIQDIADGQLDTVKLRRLLYQFKIRKQEEAKFVRIASTLSAAAAIGIFSWPSVVSAFWLARTLWYWSLYLSIFALISSASDRLLAFLPDSPISCHSDEELRELLGLMLEFPCRKKEEEEEEAAAAASSNSNSSNNNNKKETVDKNLQMPPLSSPGPGSNKNVVTTPTKGVQSWRKVFFWQNSMMLMSWSWVALLIGLTLHILTPLIMDNGQHIDRVSALMVCCVGLAVYLNFSICNFGARKLGHRLRERGLHTIIDSSAF